uniref:Uncharacterized protein n=1 Tax=viral metagenome TaxID=1070528 RepID=A0A6C0ASY6_9ZZZZ
MCARAENAMARARDARVYTRWVVVCDARRAQVP